MVKGLVKIKNNNISEIKNIWQIKLELWYKKNKRELPWRKRENQNFYNVWLSEIMLQQTNIKTVIPYFLRFKQKWPNWDDFVDAKFDEIIYLWQGLGYYQRAKNIFQTLQILKKNKNFNITHDELLKLPGIGKYSAASISAILKDENHAVVDGNIKRVISRVFNINISEKNFIKKIYAKAQELTPIKGNKSYCQSLMDLGSMVCKPFTPKCSICPINSICNFNFSNEKTYGNKKKKNFKLGMVFYITYKNYVFLEKANDRFLHGTLKFPMSEFFVSTKEFKYHLTKKEIIEEWLENNLKCENYSLLGCVKHNFTNFDLKLHIIKVILSKKKEIKFDGLWLNEDCDFDKYSFSNLMKKVKEMVKK